MLPGSHERPFYTSHYQKQWRCCKPPPIFIIVMIVWQGRLPCLRCRACKDCLAASRPPVMEPVIGWLAVRRMHHCLVNGWPIRRECGPQGKQVPIKGSFPARRFVVIVIHVEPLHTIIFLSPTECRFLCLRLVNYNFSIVCCSKKVHPGPVFSAVGCLIACLGRITFPVSS